MAGPSIILDHICTYKLSQDHLEIYFGSLRRRGGQNDNPTTKQLMANYKRLLCHPDILNSLKANCVKQDGTVVLSIDSNLHDGANNVVPDIMRANFDADIGAQFNVLVESLSNYKVEATLNIAHYLVCDLQKHIDCHYCKELLLCEECPEGGQLLKIKGTNKFASPDVSSLCILGERIFSFFENEQAMFSKNVSVLDRLLNAANNENNAVQFSHHPMDIDGVWQEEFAEHPQRLAQRVLKKYFSIRLHHYGKLKRHSLKKASMRTKRLKLTHNLGH
jgi:hypothetical protein